MPIDRTDQGASASHTPGPWEIDSQGMIFHRLDGLTKYVIAEMESGIEANERLILAAPDLLDSAIDAEDAIVDLHSALHNVMHTIDYMRCSDGTMPLSAPSKLAQANELLRAGMLDGLRSTIAKARGEGA